MSRPIRIFIAAILCAFTHGLAIGASEDQPIVPDGQEAAGWHVRKDDGAKYVQINQSKNRGYYGEQSAQLRYTVEPSNDWWTVLNLALPPNPDRSTYNVLRLQVSTGVAVKGAGLKVAATIGGKRAVAAVATERPGRWYPVDIALPEGAPSSGNLELALVHGEGGLPKQLEVYIDGPAWAQVDLSTRELKELKNLHTETSLVEKGRSTAVIVAPVGDRYDAATRILQESIEKRTGTRLPILSDTSKEAQPENLLAVRNAIVLGNMATNRFALEMYRKWYTLLDLKYPGKGGYVVRSLHNPLATGHNVIWIGGSDDAGVEAAADAFAAKIAGKRAADLSVGWLMDIRLGEGMQNPPAIPFDKAPWKDVFSWRDSYRLRPDGKQVGYGPSTFFGWNPISIAGALYYMTGRREYLDAFKAMAMPEKGKEPRPNRTDDAFNDPFDPLVKNYHYRAHLVVCVFDLIEESPDFTDSERLFLTNKFIQMQDHYDSTDTFAPNNGSRHGMWHMLCIYTGSRYLNKYYSTERWKKRIANARKSFASVIDNPTWGERDTLSWVATSTEPVFEFYMLDGFEEFVETGTARAYISAMETLWTNKRFDESNQCLTINLLHKAAHMLDDGRYIWMRERLGFDLGVFRIGQSWWPRPDLPVEAPQDIVNAVQVFELPATRWKESGKAIPEGQGFQFLSYRKGLDPDDALLQLDGFFGRARTDYHVNALYNLRLSGGRDMVHRAYANQLVVRANGMVDPSVPRAAAIERRYGDASVAYLHTRVPNMAFSEWDRYLLFLPEMDTLLALDRARARKTGAFDATVTWDVTRTLKASPEDRRRWSVSGGPVVHCAQAAEFSRTSRAIHQTQLAELAEGGTVEFANLIGWQVADNAAAPGIESLRGGGYVAQIAGQSAFFAIGPCGAEAAFESDAEAVFISPQFVVFVGGTFLRKSGGDIIRSDRPLSVVWHPATGETRVESDSTATLGIAGGTPLSIPSGASSHKTPPASSSLLSPSLNALGEGALKPDMRSRANADAVRTNWAPLWSKKMASDPIQHLASSPVPGSDCLWAAAHPNKRARDIDSASLFRISPDGKDVREIALTAPVLSLEPASTPSQVKAFALLTGDGKDMIRAYTSGGEQIWEQQAQVDPSYRIGDRWQAPWFSNPGDPHYCMGIFDLMVGDLWNKGEDAIVAARPVTLEFRKLNGDLIKRVPTQWGDNSALAVLRKRGDKGKSNLVLTAKKYTGYPAVSGVDSNYAVVANNMYSGVTPGATSMQSWMQWGGKHLEVADLDQDGIDDVILTRTGHWNELAVYHAETGGCRWMASFGPGSRRGPRFITGMKVADLDNDQFLDVAVSMLNGWVCLFNARGDGVWQKRMPQRVNAIAVAGSPSQLAVGCHNGYVYLLDAEGDTVKTARFDGSITSLWGAPGVLLVGTEKGEVARMALE